MQPTTPDARQPRPADRILLPHEEQVAVIRRHPVILAAPIAAVVISLAAIVIAASLLTFSSVTLLIAWLAWFLLLLRAIWAVAGWWGGYFIVTTERMLFIKGVLARDVTMIPMVRLSDIWIKRSGMGRLFGYGSFLVELTGVSRGRHRIDFLPYPEQLYLEIAAVIFRDNTG
jgi:membrane protein YdbS with pleckstrin-like domain